MLQMRLSRHSQKAFVPNTKEEDTLQTLPPLFSSQETKTMLRPNNDTDLSEGYTN